MGDYGKRAGRCARALGAGSHRLDGDGVIALGGVAKKSPFVMQIVADVLNMPIKVARSEQACALGSSDLRTLLRAVLHYHVGPLPLRTRQLMMDIQSL